ncbi:MAG TPA: CHRD domain-containing protein, partial [Roseiflexaceae bacterium]|nr:CHRD domain-containing protein [Roseiflexaceae bacterium]
AFTPANAAIIAGTIVLLDWTDNECGSVTRGANAVAAGAKGFILADNSAQFDLIITGSAVIPGVSTPKSVGDSLKAELASGVVNLTLSSQYASSVPYTDPNRQDTLSTFSSRGPRRDGSALKPDISAPGQGIFSVGAPTGTKGANISGTSQAAPHVAGSMALMRQLHPTWTVEELKALVMNTAVNNIRADLPSSAALLPPTRIGAGRIDLSRAAADAVLAYNDGGAGLVSVSFGNVEASYNGFTATRTVRVFNKGTSSATYNLAYVPVTTIPAVTYSLSAATVTVAAGQTESITVTMAVNLNFGSMKHVHDPTVSETQAFGTSQLPRPWISEASGYLALTKPNLASSNFAAWVSDDQENPPTGSAVTATGAFTYTAATNNLQYRIEFTKPITLTAAHFHSGLAGVNGPVVVPIPTGDNTFAAGEALIGSATLSAANALLLQQGRLYVNFHTAANPGGEIRGQVVPVLADTALRLPIYGSVRPASNMRAVASSIDMGSAPNLEATLVLTGTGVNSGIRYPFDQVSLVSAFELQYVSPNEPSSDQLNDKADLAYVGVASDVASTNAFSQTMLYFGIATHGDWSTPNEVEFDIYIDTNRDGSDDFVLFNANGGQMTGQDQNDVLLTFLQNLQTNELIPQDFLNGVAPDTLDTVVFNNNVLALPVFAADLGLTSANSTFDYRIVTLSLDAPGHEPGFSGAIEGKIDETPRLTYSAAKPGIDTSGGVAGAPVYQDLPGSTIPLKYNPVAFVAAKSKGVLLLHHYNQSGNRVQVVTAPSGLLYVPDIRR